VTPPELADLKHEESHVYPHQNLIDPVSLQISSGRIFSSNELTISAVTKILIFVEVGTSSITIEKVSQRFARANHEKTRLNRLY